MNEYIRKRKPCEILDKLLKEDCACAGIRYVIKRC